MATKKIKDEHILDFLDTLRSDIENIQLREIIDEFLGSNSSEQHYNYTKNIEPLFQIFTACNKHLTNYGEIVTEVVEICQPPPAKAGGLPRGTESATTASTGS